LYGISGTTTDINVEIGTQKKGEWPMSSPVIPWIVKLKTERDTQRLKDETKSTTADLAECIVSAFAPEFVRSLMRELQLVSDALPEIGCIGIFGAVRIAPNEEHCRLHITSVGPLVRFTYTDLFWTIGSHTIRCFTFEGRAFELGFRVSGDRLYLTDDWIRLLNPAESAERIAKPMAERVLG
jgi:hypothetical protein